MAKEAVVPIEIFSQRYWAMSEDDLLRLAADVGSLIPNAREALRKEMEGRGLPTQSIDWKAHDKTPRNMESGFYRFLRNVFIFVACDAVYLVIASGLSSQMPDGDRETFIRALTTFLGRLSFALALLTADQSLLPGRLFPKRIRTVWIIGFMSPPASLVIFLPLGFLHLTWLFWPVLLVFVGYRWWHDRAAKVRIQPAVALAAEASPTPSPEAKGSGQ